MFTARESIERSAEVSGTKAPVKANSQPFLNRVLDFLSSVRFGVVLLCILVFLSFLGMIIIQQNVQGLTAHGFLIRCSR